MAKATLDDLFVEADLRFLLDGLEIDSLAELRRIVAIGKAHDSLCPSCGWERWSFPEGGEMRFGCLNAHCPEFGQAAFDASPLGGR